MGEPLFYIQARRAHAHPWQAARLLTPKDTPTRSRAKALRVTQAEGVARLAALRQERPDYLFDLVPVTPRNSPRLPTPSASKDGADDPDDADDAMDRFIEAWIGPGPYKVGDAA